MGKDCVVVAVLSGGPDSFSYMVELLARRCRVHALTFNYGQKASREIDAARRLVEEVNRIAASRRDWGRVVEHKIVDVSFMAGLWKGTQLTDRDIDVTSEYKPSVIVPLRNVVMASIAAAYAYSLTREGERVIVAYGAQLDDARERPGDADAYYPDCTPECVESLQAAFRICHERRRRRLEVWTPSRELIDKKSLLERAYDHVGGLVYETWSCYI